MSAHARTFSGRTARLRYRPSFQMASTAAVRYAIEFDPDALNEILRMANAIGNAFAQSSDMAQKASGPDTSERIAVIVPTAAPPYIALAVAARPAGQCQTASACRQNATGKMSDHAAVPRPPSPV